MENDDPEIVALQVARRELHGRGGTFDWDFLCDGPAGGGGGGGYFGGGGGGQGGKVCPNPGAGEQGTAPT